MCKQKQNPEELLRPATKNTTDKLPLPDYEAQGLNMYPVPPDSDVVPDENDPALG